MTHNFHYHRYRVVAVLLLSVVMGLLLAAYGTSFFLAQEHQQPVKLHVRGETVETNSTIVFQGKLLLRGPVPETTFEGVEVTFWSGERDSISTVQIGTVSVPSEFTQSDLRHDFNTTLRRQPDRVTVNYTSFSHAEESTVETEGLERYNGTLVPTS